MVEGDNEGRALALSEVARLGGRHARDGADDLAAAALGLRHAQTRLAQAGVAPTREALALGVLLFCCKDRHVTVPGVRDEAAALGVRLAPAGVERALEDFAEAGLLRRVSNAFGRTYFDTTLDEHLHFYVEEEDRLFDVPFGCNYVGGLPEAPAGYVIVDVDMVIRLRRIRPEADA